MFGQQPIYIEGKQNRRIARKKSRKIALDWSPTLAHRADHRAKPVHVTRCYQALRIEKETLDYHKNQNFSGK